MKSDSRLLKKTRKRPDAAFSYQAFEPRMLLAADFGDAAASYPVTLADNGAHHEVPVVWEQLGNSIALEGFSFTNVQLSEDGSTVVISDREGNLKTFELDDGLWAPSAPFVFQSFQGKDHFPSGFDLSADGETIVYGSPNGGENEAGIVQVFDQSTDSQTGIDQWELRGENIEGDIFDDDFGQAVAISSDGNRVIIGAPSFDAEGNKLKCGQAKIYQWSGGSWQQMGSTFEGANADDLLGLNVGMLPDGTAVIHEGGLNRTQFYSWNGSDWDTTGPTFNGWRGGFFGTDRSWSADFMTYVENDPTVGQGLARVFRWDGVAWAQLGNDLAGDRLDDLFGASCRLSADGNTLFVGAPQHYGVAGEETGQVQVFQFDGADWQPLGGEIEGEAPNDYLGINSMFVGDSLYHGFHHTFGNLAYCWGNGLGTNSNGTRFAAGHVPVNPSQLYPNNFTNQTWGFSEVSVYDMVFSPTLTLGPTIDVEASGFPSVGADSDGADEDGIVFGALGAGTLNEVTVTVAGSGGRLDAWFDLNGDGDWFDAGEQIFSSESVAVGENLLTFEIPADAFIGDTYARFRLSSAGGLAPTGSAPDGEVEDYRVTVSVPPTLDFLPNRITIQNAPEQLVDLTGITSGGDTDQPLKVTATTTNSSLITRLQVDYSSPETTGQLRFTPGQDRNGEAFITVKVTDGGADNLLSTPDDNNHFQRTFKVTVQEVGDLDDVTFFLAEGLELNPEQWFQGTASRTGILTAEVVFDSSEGNADVEIYNQYGQLVETGTDSSEGKRADYDATQGEVFYLHLFGNNPDVDLRVVNLVTIDGSDVLIGGSNEFDSFVFNAARTTRISINEVEYNFDPTEVIRFDIDGGRGDNTIWFGGTVGDETVDFRQNNVQIDGPNWSPVFGSGYSAGLLNFNTVTFRGRGGEDTANFHGTSASETYNSNADVAYLTGPGYTYTAREMTSMTAHAGGGDDVAYLRDSSGDDLYETYSDRAVMTAGGYVSVASGFDRTTGRSTSGQDTVVSHDSNGNDRLYSHDDRVILAGPGYNNTAIGFDVNRTIASGQAGDIAYLFDSAGNDSLMANPDSTSLNRAGRESTAEHFSAVYAYASSGNDTADFYDSVGNDKYHGYLDRARMTGDGLFCWGRGFDSMTGHFSGGHDKAYLFDSAGNDQFVGGASDATMTDGAVTNRAIGYDTVNAYSRDGSDTATLHDSSGDELFRAYADRAVMHGTEMQCWVGGFETVTAHSSGGNDSARLFDTAGNDYFYSYANWAFLTGNGYRNEAVGFGQTTAFGSGGFDRAQMDDSVGNDTVKARAIGPKLTQGDGTIFDVRQFDQILARSVNGGDDFAEWVEFDYDFELEGGWNS